MSSTQTAPDRPQPDLLCLSHLRWDFVFQRPQQLMTRFARDRRVFFFEEPVFHDGAAELRVESRNGGVTLAVPHLPHGLDEAARQRELAALLDGLLAAQRRDAPVLWYYTPMALPWSRQVEAAAVVYDCMDELAMFKGAPPCLRELEEELLTRADLVFTGGESLYEAKLGRHRSVHCFPSSIDRRHFAGARRPQAEPADQAPIPRPRLGFFGVLDERFDRELVAGAAALRPEWHFVMLGPVVKIDPVELPQAPNVHYLGMKQYAELPAYLAGWDVAVLPFARNESTRFISPTKTPEYLAGARPVVSTSIRDVVRPYGELGLVEIADEPETFVAAVERLLRRDETETAAWLARVDAHLAHGSWDETQARMAALVAAALADRTKPNTSDAAAVAASGSSNLSGGEVHV